MTVYLLRHGETEYNTQRRYLGRTDLPLSPKGRADLVPGDFSPGIVYVSPLRRDYYAWQGPYGGGFVLDASRWTADRTLTLLRTVQYTKGGTL